MSEIPKDITAGSVFERTHPFTWVEERVGCEPDDIIERWRPGAWETKIHADNVRMACHGEGTVRFTVVSIHQPPRYQTRIFFTRHFTDPEGRDYTPSKLHHCVISKFRRDVENFAFEYEVVDI